MNNITKNQLFACKQRVKKLEKTIHLLTILVIIFACTSLILSGYVAWSVS